MSAGEAVLSGIERNYSQEAKQEYLALLEKYKNQWAFEQIYNHYIHTRGSERFKNAIDDYFSQAYFVDLPFFYFTLARDVQYAHLFSCVRLLASHSKIAKNYFSLTDLPSKQKLLHLHLGEIRGNLSYEMVVWFLDHFHSFPFQDVMSQCDETSDIVFMEKMTIFIFSSKEKYPELYQLFMSFFVLNDNVYSTIIEDFEEAELYEVISFLRQKLVSWMHERVVLSFKEQNILNELYYQARNMQFMELDEKVEYLVNKEISLQTFWTQKENYARVTLTRKILESRYWDIVGLTLGISMLSPELFYGLRQDQSALCEHLKLYIEVKNLILHIDRSLLLSLLRPFLLKDLSKYFNDGDEKYYIIKYIICIILAENYSEYLKLTKFFYNLETFFRPWITAFFWKMAQFWWLFLLLIFSLFFAPFWVFLAWVLYAFKEGIMKIVSKVQPELKMNLNFQVGTFSTLLAVFALILWGTMGLKDNMNLVYDNFKGFINALSLPTNETLSLLGDALHTSKSNVHETDFHDTPVYWLRDIDYAKDTSLSDLKKWNQQIPALNSQNWEIVKGEAQIFTPEDMGCVIIPDGTSAPQSTHTWSSEWVFPKVSKYSHVLLSKNFTIWDYAEEITRDCGNDTISLDVKRELYSNIDTFLTNHKSTLLSHFPATYKRMNVWDLASRLPQSYWDLSDLENIICHSH